MSALIGAGGPTLTGLDVLQAFQTDDMNRADVFLGVITITFTVNR